MEIKNPFKVKIFQFATQQLRFDDCRFTSSRTDGAIDAYKEWVAKGFHGEMAYLKNHLPPKENPEELLKNAKSAIVLIKNYKNTPERELKGNFKIARYAVGKDYHLTMMEKLTSLADFIGRKEPGVQCYYGVDSRPLAERTYALKSGIGFLGKNTMVIKPGLGSYFFIGAILTTAELEEDAPLRWDCGQCRICIDACPTHALIGNSQMDATRCISYMTIERKTPLTADELKETKGWVFGCDICQEVCPYNHDRTPLTDWDEFKPESGVGFDFFEKNPKLTIQDIPRNTPLYRSRQRIIPNIRMSRQV